MFVYEFEAGNTCLVTKIVISGSHLVLYTNKKNSQELLFMVRKFNLHSIISGDHPAHVFGHNAHVDFSAMGDTLPHKHLKFPSDTDRLSSLNDIFNFMLDRQHNPSIRKQDYERLKALYIKKEYHVEIKYFPRMFKILLIALTCKFPTFLKMKLKPS